MKNKKILLRSSLIAIIIISTIFYLFANTKIVEIRKENAKVVNTNATLVNSVKPSDYGKKINYSVTVNGTTLNDWRILYNDGSHVYIILSDYLPVNLVPTAAKLDNNGKYNVFSNTSRITLLDGLSTQSYWSSFARGVSGATATGAPTLEMLIDSYNEKFGKNLSYKTGQFLSSSLYLPHSSKWNDCEGYWVSYYGDASYIWNVVYTRNYKL